MHGEEQEAAESYMMRKVTVLCFQYIYWRSCLKVENNLKLILKLINIHIMKF
jgi:hypothetical protein